MKKIFILLALSFSWLTNLSAQKEQLYSLFDKYQETDGVTSIKIAKPMFGMLGKLNIQDADFDNLKPMFNKIKGLRILVLEKPTFPKELLAENRVPLMKYENLKNEIMSAVKSMHYEELISVNSKESKMKFLASNVNNGFMDDLLLSMNSDGNTVLMMLEGKISMDDVDRLASEAQNSSLNFNVNGNASESTAVTEESRKVGSFSGISVASGIKLTFTQGNSQNVKVETDGDKMQYVKTEVENGILKVFVKNQSNKSLNFKKLHVDVTAPAISKIATSSGSNFTTLNTLTGDNFQVSASSGSNISADINAKTGISVETTSGSNMKLDLKAKNLSMSATSGSNITLTGSADNATYQISSASTVNAQDLVTKNSTVSASSAADLKVNVAENLTVSGTSSASVKYRENPRLNKNTALSSGASVRSF